MGTPRDPAIFVISHPPSAVPHYSSAMPWVQFSTRDGLRIALAAGVIPVEVAARPVLMAFDRDRVSIEADDLTQFDSIRRLGGRIVAHIGEATELPNWFCGVPLVRREGEESTGPVIVEIPACELIDRLPSLLRQSEILRLKVHDELAYVHCRTVPRCDYAIYRPASTGHWIRIGFRHRLEAILPRREEDDLLFDESRTIQLADWNPWQVSHTLDLPERWRSANSPCTIPLPLKLGRDDSSRSLIRITDVAEFADWLSRLGPRVLDRVHIARLSHGGESMLIVESKRLRIPFGQPFADPTQITPAISNSVLSRITHQQPDRETWVTSTGPSIDVHQAGRMSFRPVELSFAIAPSNILEDCIRDPFELESFATHLPFAEPVAAIERSVESSPSPSKSGKTLFAKIVDSFLSKRPISATESAPHLSEPITSVVERQPLELEESVVAEYTRMTSQDRQHAWSDLAEINTQRRAWGEASLCWLNAIWETHEPRPTWFDAWRRVERDPSRKRAIDQIQNGSAAILPNDDWPIRLTWLVTLARGDSLALSRCYDALNARLRPGLAPDRDAPAFLRLAAASDDFVAVRDWLLRNREASRKWIETIMRGRGRLQRFGLDPDPQTTIAYSDCFFAEATVRLGERVIAATWHRDAEATLLREPKESVPIHRAILARLQCDSLPDNVTGIVASFAIRAFESLRNGTDPFAIVSPESVTVAQLHDWKKTNRQDLAASTARKLMTKPRMSADATVALAAAAWLAGGQVERGLTWLDACRDQLFSPHRLSPREQTRLAITTAQALGLAPPRIARGRLEELFQRLDGLDLTGSTNRYFCRQPLAVIHAAICSAVPQSFDLGNTVRDWLAEDERIVRERMSHDLRSIGVVL